MALSATVERTNLDLHNEMIKRAEDLYLRPKRKI